MRAAERAQVHAMNFLLGDEVNHGEGVAGSFRAVIGDEGEFAVVGGGDFVGAFAGVYAGDDLFCGGVNDGELVCGFIEDEEGGGGSWRLRLCGWGACGGEDERGEK